MSLRASDRDRDNTVELLAQAASDGQLTLEEYSERVDVALAARMQDELAQVVNDLQQAHGGMTVASQAGAGPPRPAPATDVGRAPERVRAILSSEHRQGRWHVPAHMQLRSVLGDITLELQSAVLSSHHTVIEAHATLGSITICVPEGVEVRMSGTAILGDKSSRLVHEPPPGAPIVEVRAVAVLGSVEVRPPKLRHELRDAVRGSLKS